MPSTTEDDHPSADEKQQQDEIAAERAAEREAARAQREAKRRVEMEAEGEDIISFEEGEGGVGYMDEADDEGDVMEL